MSDREITFKLAPAAAVKEDRERTHICPKCAPAVFDAACVDPMDPFKDGVKW
jgi:hypothetical protein